MTKKLSWRIDYLINFNLPMLGDISRAAIRVLADDARILEAELALLRKLAKKQRAALEEINKLTYGQAIAAIAIAREALELPSEDMDSLAALDQPASAGEEQP